MGDASRPDAAAPVDLRAALSAQLRRCIAAYGPDLPLGAAGELTVSATGTAPIAAPAGPPPTAGVATDAPPIADGADPASAPPQPAEAPWSEPQWSEPQWSEARWVEIEEEPADPPPIDLPGDLAAQRRIAVQCRRCKLCETRTQVVFGEGDADADVMFIGEAPGAREDESGRPFVGPAGQLLDRILHNAMGLAREDVYIANVNKCRPPGNRNPEPDEIAACLPFLRAQIAAVRPKVLVTLGRVAAQNLLGTPDSMTRLRGRELSYDGIPVVATWHPAYLLRNPESKRETWEDVKRVNRMLGRPEDPRRS